MIRLPTYNGKIVGVFGLGKAGRAAVAALQAGGAEVFADDDRSQEDVAIVPYAQWPWEKLAALVLSPGVPLTHPVAQRARQAGCEIVGEVELLQRSCPQAKKIGITGTNGKSTTTALIGHILMEAGLQPQVGGNLGTPALALDWMTGCSDDQITRKKSDHPVIRSSGHPFVLEMSSYQLDLMHTVRFDVAILLNVTPDHLDRHGDMAGYVAAKKHIFDRQTPEDVAIIGIDDEYCRAVAKGLGDRVITIHIEPRTPNPESPIPATLEVANGLLTDHRDGTQIDLSPCKGLRGAHNWQNAAAAYAACRAMGVEVGIISDALQSFSGLAHRMEWVAERGGVTYVNDSKATNADSTSKALAAYPGDIFWIAGGRPKAGGITTLGEFFPKIAHAYLLGEAEEGFAATLEGKVPYTRCGTLEVATRQAALDAEARGRGVVLLSPACASWDQWPNFEARGEAFKRYVTAK